MCAEVLKVYYQGELCVTVFEVARVNAEFSMQATETIMPSDVFALLFRHRCRVSSEQTGLMKTAEIKDGKERLAKVNDYICVMSAKTKQAGQGRQRRKRFLEMEEARTWNISERK